MTLTDFVLARIAEREAKARAAAPLFSAIIGPEQLNAHLRLNDPAAVLARCAVDRQIVAEHQQGTFTDVSLGLKDVAVCIKCHSVMGPPDEDDEDSWGSAWDDWKYPFIQDPWPCRTMALLASVDADHPDYDESWKP